MTNPSPLILKSDDASIEKASALLRDGKLVAFPTETVYGLGADATSDDAIARIFEAKERPSFNPLIVHLPDIGTIGHYVDVTSLAQKLAQAFWPGAMTLVLNRRLACPVSKLASAGLNTLAVRVPKHDLAHQLLLKTALPIAAPSANRSETISPTKASHVATSLGDRVDAILDGGPCQVGLESTVIDATGEAPVILRLGGLTKDEIEDAAGMKALIAGDDHQAPKSPGMMRRHYAPSIPLRLNVTTPAEGEGWLGFGPDCPTATLNLSPSGNLREAAANLFAMMHEMDSKTFKSMAIAPIPMEGLGLAINDRIKRAATPQSNKDEE